MSYPFLDPTNSDMSLWIRILDRRRCDFATVSQQSVFNVIVANAYKKHLALAEEYKARELNAITENIVAHLTDVNEDVDPFKKLEKMILFHLQVASDEKVKPTSCRRNALEFAKSFLKKIDELISRAAAPRVASETTSSIGASNKPNEYVTTASLSATQQSSAEISTTTVPTVHSASVLPTPVSATASSSVLSPMQSYHEMASNTAAHSEKRTLRSISDQNTPDTSHMIPSTSVTLGSTVSSSAVSSNEGAYDTWYSSLGHSASSHRIDHSSASSNPVGTYHQQETGLDNRNNLNSLGFYQNRQDEVPLYDDFQPERPNKRTRISASHGLDEANLRFFSQTGEKTWKCLVCLQCLELQESSLYSHACGKQHRKSLMIWHEQGRRNDNRSNCESYSAGTWNNYHPSIEPTAANIPYAPAVTSMDELYEDIETNARRHSENGRIPSYQHQNVGSGDQSGHSSDLGRLGPPHSNKTTESSTQLSERTHRKSATTNDSLDNSEKSLRSTTATESNKVSNTQQENSAGKKREHPSITPMPSGNATAEQRNNTPPMLVAAPLMITANVDSPPTFARTVIPRPRTDVLFSPLIIDANTAKEVGLRLREWDPFWCNIKIVGVGVTSTVTSTMPTTVDSKKKNLISRACQFELNLDSYRTEIESVGPLNWKSDMHTLRQHGSAQLLLRMLPLNLEYYRKKRADCHLWPKGTFLQVNNTTISIYQRRQQDHDTTLWKGMCKDVDLAENFPNPLKNMGNKHTVAIFTYDTDLYAYVVALAKYRNPNAIFESLIDPKSPERITYLGREESLVKGLKFSDGQTLVLDDSDNEAEKAQVGKFVFTLTCPITKTLMTTPVRGKKCKHYQCFDLRSYITSNEIVSGSRWRCGSCEGFLSLQDLEVCGFTSSLLKEFANDLSVDRDRVELCSDRSYKLLGERQSRYKRRASTNDNPTTTVNVSSQSSSKQFSEPIVIDLE